MDERARAWFDRRTSSARDWHLADLLAAKGEHRVTVILPALDEQATVGGIVACIVDELMGTSMPLVDQVVVIDSGSTDATADRARAAGARVLAREDVWPSIPIVPGKGEAMWRALGATVGATPPEHDLIVFVDADLRSFTAEYVIGLLGPLLSDPTVCLVKAVYERPLVEGATTVPAGGGRVTELVARPLLNLHWPELSGVAQPLAGEYAARRSLLERLPFPTGYGVEFALLVDTAQVAGLDSIAQVDLGVRLHRHHDEQRLGRMAAEIWQTALERLDPDGRVRRLRGASVGNPLLASVVQFVRTSEGLEAIDHPVAAIERPPLIGVPGYRAAPTTGR